MPAAVAVWLLLVLPTFAAPPPDPRELILKSAMMDARDQEIRRNYTYVQHEQRQSLDSSGAAKKTERRAFEVIVLHGRPYRRLVERDGAPLTSDDERKEREKLDRESNKRARESDTDRKRHRENLEKDLREQRQLREEVADAFHFKLAGEDTVAGRPAWIIEAEPKPGFKPRSSEGKMFPKVRGRLWVDQREFRWVKLEAQVIDSIWLAGFLAKLNPGATMSFEAAKIGDELWMPRRAAFRGDARVALVKSLRLAGETRWENFRKFQSDSRVISTGGVPGTP